MNGKIYAEVRDALKENRAIMIRTEFTGHEGRCGEDLKKTLLPLETDGADAGVTCREESGVTVLTEPVLPPERLLILGGGHVAVQICEFAAKCGFRVTVCDDRPDFAERERFPGAKEVLCLPFDRCIEEFGIGANDYAVIVTRGHVHDGECLRRLLSGTRPAYIGMIGSRRKVGILFAMLREEGFPEEALSRVCAPVGLPIGGVTAEEIAVSVTAQLIAYRRLPEHAEGRVRSTSDLEPELMGRLAESRGPWAVATIIKTEGSTPRYAGAKMAVDPDGRIIGTIGGGMAEGAVIREARALAGKGRFRLCAFDMRGEKAAEEGMVCGGIMQVLIEDLC